MNRVLAELAARAKQALLHAVCDRRWHPDRGGAKPGHTRLHRVRSAGEANWYLSGFTIGVGGWYAWVDIVLPAERLWGLRLLDEGDLTAERGVDDGR